VFLEHASDLIDSSPSLTQIARVPAEVGRIEFKAFDSCGDFDRYASLSALLKGLVMDQTLPGRLLVPDAKWHQRSAQHGFRDDAVYEGACDAIAAAKAALRHTGQLSDCALLQPLEAELQQRTTPAQRMIDAYNSGIVIPDVLKQGYQHTQVALQAA